MMSPEQAPAGPLAEARRIPSLDVIRGFALLGILIMNIQSFSMIYAAYFNPTTYGDLSGIHLWVWIFSHLFVDQKFMNIFAILFGAGIILLAGRAEASGRSAAVLHYRRMVLLIGMGLYKLGFFQPPRPLRFSFILIALALLVGLPVTAYGVHRMFASGWDVTYTFFLGGQFNYWGSLLVSFGWMGAIYWVGATTSWATVTRPLAAVGKTAFSNYILQTLVCTTIFFGQGLALFGRIERLGQILIVLGVWAVQLLGSTLWLRWFHSGPLEWLWRSLTYGQRPPFRR